MRIWSFSDLHLEVVRITGALSVPEADVCVIAGDLTNPGSASIQWIADNILPHMPCVYVLGNHDFWGGTIEGITEDALLEARRHEGMHLLVDGSAVIGGTRFVGCTLWTDFRLMGRQREAMDVAQGRRADFRNIEQGQGASRGTLTPRHTLDMHEDSRAFLHSELAVPFAGPTVVVTHHCPHERSVHPRYGGDILNASYSSDLSDVIELHRPDLWLHGHTHSACDYRVGRTRIVCNPGGYAHEDRTGFDPSLVIRVPGWEGRAAA